MKIGFSHAFSHVFIGEFSGYDSLISTDLGQIKLTNMLDVGSQKHTSVQEEEQTPPSLAPPPSSCPHK